MHQPTRGRLLLLGVVSSLGAVGLSILIASFSDAVGWQAIAIAGLLLVGLIFTLPLVQPGSQMPGFADASEISIEVIARQASQDGLSDFRPSTIRIVWLWALLAPALSLGAIGLFF